MDAITAGTGVLDSRNNATPKPSCQFRDVPESAIQMNGAQFQEHGTKRSDQGRQEYEDNGTERVLLTCVNSLAPEAPRHRMENKLTPT